MTRKDFEHAILHGATYFPVTDEQFDKFEALARECGSATGLIGAWMNYKLSDRKDKYPERFFEWWESNRPDQKNEYPKKQHVRKVDSAALPGFKELPWRKP